MATAIGTRPLTTGEILTKLITCASDGLVLEVYARIQADRKPYLTRRLGSDGVKSWLELVVAAVQENALTPEEGADLLCEIGQ